MSVQSFINDCYNSDIDFSNVNVDEFIRCIKSLNRILDSTSNKSAKRTRDRQYNSMLSRVQFQSDRFDPRRISNYYTFTCCEVQIDVCISGRTFGLCCSGWFPSRKGLIMLFNQRNLNYSDTFDFITEKNIDNYISKDSGHQYFIGDLDHFGLNEVGLKRILIIWSYAVSSYMSYKFRC